MSIEIKGLGEVVRTIKSLNKQFNFAAARACNDIAKDVQDQSLKELPNRFVTRSKGTPWQKPGSKFGINIRFANRDNPEAIVGTQADWMKLQEEGGTKTGRGHRIAIPTRFWKAREEIMAAKKKPRRILEAKLGQDLKRQQQAIAKTEFEMAGPRYGLTKAEKKQRHDAKERFRLQKMQLRRTQSAMRATAAMDNKPFEATINGNEGIFVRTTAARRPIKALFWYADKAQVKAAWKFVESGSKFVAKNFSRVFGKRMAEAIVTAKK